MKKRSAARLSLPWEVTETMFLSEDEVGGLLRHLRDAERKALDHDKRRALVDRLIIEILLFSGLRNSELCQLTIAETEVGTGLSQLIVGTADERRSVYLPQSLSREIVEFVRGVRRELVLKGQDADDDSQTLILNERGRPYDRTSLYRRVVRILTAAGLGERASVQLLRHTYGYLAYKRTHGNLLFVQQQLGHAHPMVTAVYARFVKFSYADLADAVGGPAFPSESPPPSRSSRKTRSRKANK